MDTPTPQPDTKFTKTCLLCTVTFVTTIPEEDVCEACQLTYETNLDQGGAR